MRDGARTSKLVYAARTVGDGAHGARREVVATAASDRRSLHALRNEPRAAIGAAMRSSSGTQRSTVVRVQPVSSRACTLHEAAAW